MTNTIHFRFSSLCIFFALLSFSWLCFARQTVEASLAAALGLHAAWASKFGKIEGLRVWHYGRPLTPPRLRAIADRISTGLPTRVRQLAALLLCLSLSLVDATGDSLLGLPARRCDGHRGSQSVCRWSANGSH
jgi:hypothetical protein